MHFQFTPAAERALLAATAWSVRTDTDELDVPEVLLGLLAEPECRAALLLASRNIGAPEIRQNFPELADVESIDLGRAEHLSNDLLQCLTAAERLLIDYPSPLVLATEHLLLGIAAAGNEVSHWLRSLGLSAEAIENEVHRWSGHRPGPLPLDLADETLPLDALASERFADEHWAATRILDASANRAAEGLRVVEDYVRFALDDRHLTDVCKGIRHRLAAALAELPEVERLAARDTTGDVGTEITLSTEQARVDARAVAAASLQRVKQALRSLEEFAKMSLPDAAAAFERLRYDTYTLERAIGITTDAIQRLAGVRLYVLVDGSPSPTDFERLVSSLCAAGAGAIQLRDKSLNDRDLVTRARLLVELTRDSGTLSIINDRPDVALVCGADGVHVGQEELPVKDARRVIGPRGLVGVSTHSLEQARAAVLDGANYIGVGPTFPSTTKSFREFTGVDLLAQVHAEIRLPAFAIGGVNETNLQQVLASGFRRIAVSGAVTAASDPAAAARRLLAMLGNG